MWTREIDEMGIVNQSTKDESCWRLIKIILLSLLVFIFVGAIAILGIGIWTHEVEYGSKQLAGLVGIQLYQVDSVIMIACGTATIIMSLVGILGIWLPNKCLLGLHVSVQTFLAIGLFTAGILGYVFATDLEDIVAGALKKSLTEKYGLPKHQSITDQWDFVQARFDCCGASGDANSTTSWALYKKESFWFINGYSNGSYVPKSCCDSSNLEYCTGLVNYTQEWPPRFGPPIVEAPTNYTLYTVGCYDQLKDSLKRNGVLLGTAAVVVGVFMCVEFVLSVCFYRTIK